MQSRYEKTVTILPSQVDPWGRLSVVETFNLFMDVATEAAEELGLGMNLLRKKGLFWITVKTRARFLNRPGILDRVQVTTWPERPGDKRCDRYYEISRDGEALVQGKTEWAVVNVLTHKPQKLAKLMPEGLEYPGGIVCPEPFPMIDEDFQDEPFAQRLVRATDIDMARHMNNVAYIRAIVDAFSTKEWKQLDVRQMDVIFRASAHEGDTLRFKRRQSGNLMDIGGSLPDGSTSVLARIEMGK